MFSLKFCSSQQLLFTEILLKAIHPNLSGFVCILGLLLTINLKLFIIGKGFETSKALADLGGVPGARPSYGTKFFRFHIHFCQKAATSEVHAPPPPMGPHPPPYGKSWIRHCKVQIKVQFILFLHVYSIQKLSATKVMSAQDSQLKRLSLLGFFLHINIHDLPKPPRRVPSLLTHILNALAYQNNTMCRQNSKMRRRDDV